MSDKLDPEITMTLTETGVTCTVPRAGTMVTHWLLRQFCGSFSLLLACLHPDNQPQGVAHLTFDPVLAKQLANMLNFAIQEYEKHFGEIKLSSGQVKPPVSSWKGNVN